MPAAGLKYHFSSEGRSKGSRGARSTKRGVEEWVENLIELHAYHKLGKFRKQMFSSNLPESAERRRAERRMPAANSQSKLCENLDFLRVFLLSLQIPMNVYIFCIPCGQLPGMFRRIKYLRNVYLCYREHCRALRNIASGRRRTHGVAFAANVWSNETEILSAIRDYTKLRYIRRLETRNVSTSKFVYFKS